MGKKKRKSQVASTMSSAGSDDHCAATLMWEVAKQKGNSLYGLCRYREALKYYSRAIELLQKDVSLQNKPSELCKLFGNRSATYYQLYTGEHPQNTELLQKALEEGMQSIAVDSSYEKGHFRCAVAMLKLGQHTEAIQQLTHILDLYQWRGTDYRTDSLLLRTLADCKYMTAAKARSPCWNDVRYKENCMVVDPHGAGDFTNLADCIAAASDKVSILVKPGNYHLTRSLVISGDEDVDVLGDIDDDRKPSEVTIFVKGKQCDPACHIFCVLNGAKLSLRNLSLRQEAVHSERHGLFMEHNSEVTLINCYGYSNMSAFAAVSCDSRLFMRHCRLVEACGAVIVTGRSYAQIEGCTIKDCARIGVEMRDSGFAVITDTEFINNGSQAIVTHAAGLGFASQRCIIHGNCSKLSDQLSVMVGSGVARIDECQITSQAAGGVMVHGGGCCQITKTRMSGGNSGIGFSEQGSGRISDCHISNSLFGLSIMMNRPGQVVLSGNTINARCAEILISNEDDVPTMIGGVKHDVMRPPTDFLSPDVKGQILRRVELAESDPIVDADKWRDARSLVTGRARVCRPCGLSEQSSKKSYSKCSACRLSWYCSKQCQAKDWPFHKATCAKVQQLWQQSESSSSTAGEAKKSSMSNTSSSTLAAH